MIYKTLNIDIDYARIGTTDAGFQCTLTPYLPENSDEVDPHRRRPTVVVLPGGGYAFRSRREAEPIALKFLAEDCNAALLEYSVAPTRFPAALLQTAQAVALLRERAEEWNVDPDRIAVCGFSAGGHLAASYGTLWNRDFITDYYGYRNNEHKPNGMILCYPVITSGKRTHGGSIENLLGEKKDDPELLELVSCEKQVTEHTPRAFIWHSFDDGAVPIQNSLMMASALAEKNINTELHIFPHAPHGSSLANATVYGNYDGSFDECQVWIDMAVRWVKNI
ncbi:MAG: alpha/beta hydrolase [Clostridia bacterium]|nr:alpha/beta hydrolase [Clostridia bacterium]